MPRSRLIRHSFRKLLLESLQNRQLMAADLTNAMELFSPAVTSPTEFTAVSRRAAAVMNSTVLNNAASNTASTADTGALHFQSESDTLAKLTGMAVEHWRAFFGKNTASLSDYSLIATPDGFANQSITPRVFSANSVVLADSAAASANYTNVQTSGVDESDNAAFSSDGFAFVFRDQLIRIIDINDSANLKEVSRIEMPGLTATMHLYGNKLVVISQGYEAQTSSASFSPPVLYYTQVKFFDVTNRAAPVSTGSVKLSGSLAVSRIVDSKLVLVQNTQSAIPVLETINSSTTPDWWTSRYETEQEYLARITPMILNSTLVSYQQIGSDGKEVSSGVLGDWRDVANAGGTDSTTVVAIDLNGDSPKPTAVESVLGRWVTNTYVTEQSIYLTFAQPDGLTRIVHLDLDNEGEISADGFGDVKGTIRNSRFMDEFDGHLRVVTSEDGSASNGRIRNSANIFVMQVTDGELKTVGSLLDISPGDQAYSVEFEGERALVTTGFIDPFTLYWRDPLHGIDLSDPTQPKELSDVVIPGINSYVHWVDSNHLIGVGMVEVESLWYTQVSLFDVTDLSAPKTIDVWRGTTQVSPWNFGANLAMDIRYDAESKTLTIPQSQNQVFQPWLANPMLIDRIFWSPISPVDPASSDPAGSDVLVLSIDIAADKPITLRAEVGDGSGMGRAVVVGDTLVALTNVYLSTYTIDDPTKVLDRILLSNPLRMDSVSILPGVQTTIIDVLANDSRLVDYTITAIKRNGLQGSVRILADQRLEYTNPTTFDSNTNSWWDSFEYEVTTSDGAKFTAFVSIYGQRSGTDLPVDATATISIAEGDEFWIEVLVQDGRDSGQGVFSAYVDVAFDTSSFEIVGDAEALSNFTNRFSGEKTSGGWRNLGGFRNSTTPTGAGIQSLARFKIRATEDAVLNMTVSPSSQVGSELTLYGIDTVIPISNITSGSLQLPITTVVSQVIDYDVNADGIISPIDSLIVINRLNREIAAASSEVTILASSDNNKLDVNRDGIVSLLDVLSLVNRINQEPAVPLANATAPMMNTVETTGVTKKK